MIIIDEVKDDWKTPEIRVNYIAIFATFLIMVVTYVTLLFLY